MHSVPPRVLFIGYGNPSRQDDGLGPALYNILKEKDLPGVTFDTDLQLNIEDAMSFAGHDIVIFADADISGPEPFHFSPVKPLEEISYSTHSVSPESLLGMTHRHFGINIKGFVLGMRGYEFGDFGETLSDNAQKNLEQAVAFIESTILNNTYESAASKYAKYSD